MDHRRRPISILRATWVEETASPRSEPSSLQLGRPHRARDDHNPRSPGVARRQRDTKPRIGRAAAALYSPAEDLHARQPAIDAEDRLARARGPAPRFRRAEVPPRVAFEQRARPETSS